MTNYIPVITRGYSRKISLDEIMYLEQRQRRLAVVTENETTATPHVRSRRHAVRMFIL